MDTYGGSSFPRTAFLALDVFFEEMRMCFFVAINGAARGVDHVFIKKVVNERLILGA